MIKLQCLTLDLAEAYTLLTVDLVVLVNQVFGVTAALQINHHELNVLFLLDHERRTLPAMV